MATSLYLPTKPMPAAAGHSWVRAEAFAIYTPNDLPRGS
jgi:hypothetical protein